MDVEQIESRIDKSVAGAVAVSDAVGGVMFKDMMQVMEFAKMMSVSGTAVPRHLRANPGASLAVCVQALEWHMSPFSVANKSYEVNDRIAYEAQLIMAVINARAPLQKRLRYTYTGEGPELRCTVSGLLKGETEPLEYQSPAIKDIRPQNSPLWKTDPRQQLGYYSGRNWARRFCPEVILGIYAEDELRDSEIGPNNARDITPEKPAIKDRLKGQAGRSGFHAENTAALPPPSDTTLDANTFSKGENEPVTVSVDPVAIEAAAVEISSDPKPEDEGHHEKAVDDPLAVIRLAGQEAASHGTNALADWWKGLAKEQRTYLEAFKDKTLKPEAKKADECEIRGELWSAKTDDLNFCTSLEEVNVLDAETKAIFEPYADLSENWRKLCNQRRHVTERHGRVAAAAIAAGLTVEIVPRGATVASAAATDVHDALKKGEK